ncbi:MAG: ribonuclease P protein component [Patescibacteria group bacterium]|nr:ribonuclease P protein component [Patescibacteria group bacterium]
MSKRGTEIRFPLIAAKFFPNGLPYGRCGVVIRKGLVKKASDRNAIRRAILRTAQSSDVPRKLPGIDLLIVVRGVGNGRLPDDLARETSNAISDIMQR